MTMIIPILSNDINIKCFMLTTVKYQFILLYIVSGKIKKTFIKKCHTTLFNITNELLHVILLF